MRNNLQKYAAVILLAILLVACSPLINTVKALYLYSDTLISVDGDAHEVPLYEVSNSASFTITLDCSITGLEANPGGDHFNFELANVTAANYVTVSLFTNLLDIAVQEDGEEIFHEWVDPSASGDEQIEVLVLNTGQILAYVDGELVLNEPVLSSEYMTGLDTIFYAFVDYGSPFEGPPTGSVHAQVVTHATGDISAEVGNNAPVNIDCDSDEVFDVGVDGWVNVTVFDADFVADLEDVYILVTEGIHEGGDDFFVLIWYGYGYPLLCKTGTFEEVYDPNELCVISENSMNETVDANTVLLSFCFQLTGAMNHGSADVYVSTDDSETEDEDLYSEQFSVNFYFDITIVDSSFGWTGLHPGDVNATLNAAQIVYPDDFEEGSIDEDWWYIHQESGGTVSLSTDWSTSGEQSLFCSVIDGEGSMGNLGLTLPIYYSQFSTNFTFKVSDGLGGLDEDYSLWLLGLIDNEGDAPNWTEYPYGEHKIRLWVYRETDEPECPWNGTAWYLSYDVDIGGDDFGYSVIDDFALNNTYQINLQVDAIAGAITLVVNGSAVISLTGLDIEESYDGLSGVWLGAYVGSNAFSADVYFDEFVTTDLSGDGAIDFIITANGYWYVSVKADAAYLVSGENTIACGAILFGGDLVDAIPLTTDYQGFTGDQEVFEQEYYVILWITIPNPQQDGTYTLTISFSGGED